MDARVQAIRDDKKVGRGSCSTIDECYTDLDLIQQMDEEDVMTPQQAVRWARNIEGLRIEQATNFRWGEDSDPELKRYKNWNES